MYVCESFSLIFFYFIGQFIRFFSTKNFIFKLHCFDGSCICYRIFEYRKFGTNKILCHLNKWHTKSQIWFITSILIYSFPIFEFFEGNSNFFVRRQCWDKLIEISLYYRIDIFLINKRHFTINLIKFTRMSICPRIFITKTWCNLKIFINSSYHKQLFILLWCLW